MYICRLVNSFGSEVSSLTLWLPARWLSCKENLLLRPNFGIWAMHWGWKICLYHKGCHMIHSFSSEQHKGHLLNRNCTDVFQRQPHRFRCLLSLFLCHVEEWTPPLWPHHISCTVSCCSWGKPAGHMTGDFHCKEGRQEVEWKPGLSTASLNTRPQQGQVTVNKQNYGRHWGGLLSNGGCTYLRP